MSASAHSNEQYEILLRNVSLALGDAVLQLIKNHKRYPAAIFFHSW
jgi:hypothetical protein